MNSKTTMMILMVLILSCFSLVDTKRFHATFVNIYTPSIKKQTNILQLEKPKRTSEVSSRILNSYLVTALEPLPLNITINFITALFEQIPFYKRQEVFVANITFSDKSYAVFRCSFDENSTLKISGIYKKDQNQTIKKEYKIIQSGWNKISYHLQFEYIILPKGVIRTLIEFQETKPKFQGIITNISVQLHQENRQALVIASGQLTQWIGNVEPVTKPLSLMSLVLPTNMTSQKTPHNIKILGNGKKLLVCHDMANGYKQDINQYDNGFAINAYRFHHWQITDIFVYFSHQNIAIPPKHYRQLCKQHEVVCLGTFIIQKPLDWMKFQIADFLIFTARQYQFDGYLINIQKSVANVTLFKQWLDYITKNIHMQLPNSIIILYDAIIQNGTLKYQSGINKLNADFFKKVDYFFTDYHWNNKTIAITANNSQQLHRSTDVFMGNDLWGRGTFGGGKTQTYKGVKQINKYNLSTAIFAPAFAYQVDGLGRKNYSLFERIDDQIWFGKVVRNISTFTFVQTTEDSKKMNTQKQRLIKKTAYYPFPIGELISELSFSVIISSLQKSSSNFYTITLQFLNQKLTIVRKVKLTNNHTQSKKQIRKIFFFNDSEQLQIKSIRINETTVINNKNTTTIQFKNQSLEYKYNKHDGNITSFFKQRQYKLPFQSFYNIGVGPSFYFNGRKMINNSGYSFLADYDLPYQNKEYFIKDSFDSEHSSKRVNVHYDQSTSWVGGGSLKIFSIDKSFALRLLKLNQTVQNFNVLLILKNNLSHAPRLGLKYSNTQQIVNFNINKVDDFSSHKNNEWIQLSFHIKYLEPRQIKSIYLIVDSNQINNYINIGQLSIYSNAKIVKYSSKPQIAILQCLLNKTSCLNIYINLVKFPQNSKKVFVFMNEVVIGTMYQSSMYFQNSYNSVPTIIVKLVALSFEGVLVNLSEKEFNIKI